MGQPRATTHPPDPYGAKPGPGAPGWKGPHFTIAAPPATLPWCWAPTARRMPALPQGRRLVVCLPLWTLCHGGLGTPRPWSGVAAPPGAGWRQAPGPSTALSSGEDTPICLLGRRPPPCRHRPLRFGFNPW